MPVVRFYPTSQALTVPHGMRLLDVCYDAGVEITASCGGGGTCGKCRIKILEGDVPSGGGHDGALSKEELAEGWRLSCLIHVESDLTVDVSHIVKRRDQILTDLIPFDLVPDHGIYTVNAHLPEPELGKTLSDVERLQETLAATSAVTLNAGLIPYAILQSLPQHLRQSNGACRIVAEENRILTLLPAQDGDDENKPLGVAVDIGTTTVAAMLIDLESGHPLAVCSRVNPQTRMGDDVISRIAYARKGTSELKKIQSVILDALDAMVIELCESSGRQRENIARFTLAGNTTMQHLLLGIDPTPIAQAPYVPAVRDHVVLQSGHLQWQAMPGAVAEVLPAISGYVGGDIVAGIVATGIDRTDRNCLLVDIGTNGEIALASGGVLYACSTAAGPAFEGARIGQGMRASTGAISSVKWADDQLTIGTVDHAPARGICGTGLLDAVAALLHAGLLDETGRMLLADEMEVESDAAHSMAVLRMREATEGRYFVLAEDSPDFPDSPGCSEQGIVCLTQQDVREFQLAKGAIAAGILVLLEEAGIEPEDLDEVLLAGAFGNYLRGASALATGLLPPGVSLEKIRPVGNSALAGACAALLNRPVRQRARDVMRKARYVELSGSMAFQMAFAETMEFPVPE